MCDRLFFSNSVYLNTVQYRGLAAPMPVPGTVPAGCVALPDATGVPVAATILEQRQTLIGPLWEMMDN